MWFITKAGKRLGNREWGNLRMGHRREFRSQAETENMYITVGGLAMDRGGRQIGEAFEDRLRSVSKTVQKSGKIGSILASISCQRWDERAISGIMRLCLFFPHFPVALSAGTLAESRQTVATKLNTASGEWRTETPRPCPESRHPVALPLSLKEVFKWRVPTSTH